MHCTTAKHNPVLLRLAIQHYLKNDKGSKTPLFTFISLYSDSEPYPLTEVLTVLNERITELEGLKFANETDKTQLMIFKKQLSKLESVASRMRN